MDRRTFLTRFPFAVTGGATALLAGAPEDNPEREELRALLEQATNQYEQARDLIHYPWQWDETKPLLESALEIAAQVWLRQRGVAALRKHCDWTFTACNVRDEISGVAWNEASTACRMLQSTCVHVGPARRKENVTNNALANLQERGRRDLVTALDNVSQCIEATRLVFQGMGGSLPARPEKRCYW
ncbi:MAG: hypothetical protein QM769_05745 [Pseudoxanthomonas sp.]